MKTMCLSVPAVDVAEVFPFAVRKTKTLQESFAEQDRAKAALVTFVEKLEKQYGQTIYYMGLDVIGEKSYERFIFDKGGFLEVMTESPVALNAHFVHGPQAAKFMDALKKTLKSILPSEPRTQLLIDSIEIQTEEDASLTVEGWRKMKSIRGVA
ncbi:MAG TPA: hypothetical protein VLJ21_00835 [Candidatus Binatia bacterium]|nr:hypothetical protein [Candidatus Binatia bacterium]